jgi:hypothetical protein
MGDLAYLVQIVLRADYEAIETARDGVVPGDLAELARVYTTLPSWRERLAMVHLVQDHLDPRLRPMMEDALRAPGDLRDDALGVAKAIALCHLHADFDRFPAYYGDRQRLARDVDQYLSMMGDGAEEKPASKPESGSGTEAETAVRPPASASPLEILGAVALIVGVGLLVLSLVQGLRLSRFRRDGVAADARVISVYEDRGITDDTGEGAACLEVSFFEGSILEGGDLHFADICDFVPPAVRRSLRPDDRVAVLYLPRDPEQDVVLRSAVESGVSTAQLVLGAGGVLLGAALLVVNRHYQVRGRDGR